MMPDSFALDSTVVRPGAWLKLKAWAPFRLRHVFAAIERRLYQDTGVFVWLDERRIRCAVDAAPVFLPHPDHAEERVLMQRVFESLRPGDCFLDVGSHVGLYAIGAALRVGPSGRVMAFEPTPATVAKLSRNVALNKLTRRIQIQELAVSDSPGSIEFVTSGTSMMNSIFTGDPDGHRRGARVSIQVRTAPLDDFFEPACHTVAKIDTEGHELPVLRGAGRLLASDARVFLELHPWAWDSKPDTWRELLDICATHRRRMRFLDGNPVTRPEHRRIELAREHE